MNKTPPSLSRVSYILRSRSGVSFQKERHNFYLVSPEYLRRNKHLVSGMLMTPTCFCVMLIFNSKRKLENLKQHKKGN